ncbi:hypothetical protein BD626DRAFT_507428 [Schizophyllum amplum]|uniref:Uncharacterized protein n=1 Tax=Schizophyllum amplum TaxID=97359 RepID=A0A550C3Z6_9AGAR|nr:hypothetical protein BD626DRAFT_507428 [Auriculariopsis ampla]
MARADSPLLGLQDEPCPSHSSALDIDASDVVDALYNPSRYLAIQHANNTRRGGSGHSPASSISSISAVSTDIQGDPALPSSNLPRHGAPVSPSHLSSHERESAYNNRLVQRLSGESDARSTHKTSPRSAKTHSISPSISSIAPPSLSSHSPSPSVSSSIVTPRSRSSSFRNAVYVFGGDTGSDVVDATDSPAVSPSHKGKSSFSVLRNSTDSPMRPHVGVEDSTPRQSMDSDVLPSPPRAAPRSPPVRHSPGLPASPRPGGGSEARQALQSGGLNRPVPPPSFVPPPDVAAQRVSPARASRPPTLRTDAPVLHVDILSSSPALRRAESPAKLSTPTFASAPRTAFRRQFSKPAEQEPISRLTTLREHSYLGISREPTSSCYSVDPVDPSMMINRTQGKHFRPESLADDQESVLPVEVRPSPEPEVVPPPAEHIYYAAEPAPGVEGDYIDEIADSYFDSPMHSPAISRQSSLRSMARSAHRAGPGPSDSPKSFPSRWNDDDAPSPSASQSSHRLKSQTSQPEIGQPMSKSSSAVVRPTMRPRASTSKLVKPARPLLSRKPASAPIPDADDGEDFSRPSTSSSKARESPSSPASLPYSSFPMSPSIPPSPFSGTMSLPTRSPGPSTPSSFFEDHAERPKTRERSNTLDKFKSAIRTRKRSLIGGGAEGMKQSGDLPAPPKSAKEPASSQWYADDDDQKTWLSSLRKMGRNNKSSVWS